MIYCAHAKVSRLRSLLPRVLAPRLFVRGKASERQVAVVHFQGASYETLGRAGKLITPVSGFSGSFEFGGLVWRLLH